LKFLAENPTATINFTANALGMTIRSVERHIATLKEVGLVEREGATKKGRWIVKQ
jgi:predicted HTH transcriptional regulator